MNTTVKFGKKLSIAAFKTMHNASSSPLKVIENPNGGKKFLSLEGETVGAVSTNYNSEISDKEMVELLFEDGTTLWCLHNPSQANVLEEL